ncbi:Hypothetical predicted protein [Octopus vulgaris]|uniref:Uncharacterized protein n=1 Tax=Octopus vulgaris TaxID=6645 RepID=A0AA36BZQ5_OCTVU|nr:Hypothetical predicted protein [Octopus vulgaris]
MEERAHNVKESTKSFKKARNVKESTKSLKKADVDWTFRDKKTRYARVSLKEEGWQCKKEYKIGILKGNPVLGQSIYLEVKEMPYMERPVFWRNKVRTIECNKEYCENDTYAVRQIHRNSTLYIENITRGDLFWRFYDKNSCNATITLGKEDNEAPKDFKVATSERYSNGSQCERVYKIIQKGSFVLGGNMTLQTEEIPNMQRIITWKNVNESFQCDRTCYKSGRVEVQQSGNTSTILIKNISQADVDWTFHDKKYRYARVSFKEEGWQCKKEYKIVIFEGNPVLGQSIDLEVKDMPYMERPVVWRNRVRTIECNKEYCENDTYAVRQIHRRSTLYIENITREDLFWRFYDKNSCNATITLGKEDNETTTDCKVATSEKYSNGERIAISLCIFFFAGVMLFALIRINLWRMKKKLV